jgi:hypothetical protein
MDPVAAMMLGDKFEAGQDSTCRGALKICMQDRRWFVVSYYETELILF